jgi:4-hydroxy-4-methyl-2-oxoglutarate aldolase
MKTVVVRNIRRADADVVKRLGALGASTVHEAYGRVGLMKPYLRPAWAGGEAAGTAVTVLAHPGDNWMIHVAVEQCRPGDILVVGCSADNTDGMFGDLLATSLMARGVTGLIIDAGCRDVKSLREMDFRCGRRRFRPRARSRRRSAPSTFPWYAPESMLNRAMP